MIYRNLKVWQLGKELTIDIYNITKLFPAEERFGLISQINRAAVSIPSNLAEGLSRTSNKEQIHFIEFSYGSLMELACQIEIAYELKYINNEQINDIFEKIEKLAVMLSNYKKSKKLRDNAE